LIPKGSTVQCGPRANPYIERSADDGAIAKEWVRYEGPQHGEGWEHTGTGDVRYVDEKPEGEPVDAPEPESPGPGSESDHSRIESELAAAADDDFEYAPRTAAELIGEGADPEAVGQALIEVSDTNPNGFPSSFDNPISNVLSQHLYDIEGYHYGMGYNSANSDVFIDEADSKFKHRTDDETAQTVHNAYSYHGWIGGMFTEKSAPIFQHAASLTGNERVPEGKNDLYVDPLGVDVPEASIEAIEAKSEQTTEILRDTFGDTVTVFRGISSSDDNPTTAEPSNASDKLRDAADGYSVSVRKHRSVEGWTTDPYYAARYAKGRQKDAPDGVMIEREIPVERALAASHTCGGLGHLESEIVVAHDDREIYDPEQLTRGEDLTVETLMDIATQQIAPSSDTKSKVESDADAEDDDTPIVIEAVEMNPHWLHDLGLGGDGEVEREGTTGDIACSLSLAIKEWVRYEGPQHGEGWQHSGTSEVRYQENKPQDDPTGGAAGGDGVPGTPSGIGEATPSEQWQYVEPGDYVAGRIDGERVEGEVTYIDQGFSDTVRFIEVIDELGNSTHVNNDQFLGFVGDADRTFETVEIDGYELEDIQAGNLDEGDLLYAENADPRDSLPRFVRVDETQGDCMYFTDQYGDEFSMEGSALDHRGSLKGRVPDDSEEIETSLLQWPNSSGLVPGMEIRYEPPNDRGYKHGMIEKVQGPTPEHVEGVAWVRPEDDGRLHPVTLDQYDSEADPEGQRFEDIEDGDEIVIEHPQTGQIAIGEAQVNQNVSYQSVDFVPEGKDSWGNTVDLTDEDFYGFARDELESPPPEFDVPDGHTERPPLMNQWANDESFVGQEIKVFNRLTGDVRHGRVTAAPSDTGGDRSFPVRYHDEHGERTGSGSISINGGQHTILSAQSWDRMDREQQNESLHFGFEYGSMKLSIDDRTVDLVSDQMRYMVIPSYRDAAVARNVMGSFNTLRNRKPRASCWSEDGEFKIKLSSDASLGTTVHEMGHALAGAYRSGYSSSYIKSRMPDPKYRRRPTNLSHEYHSLKEPTDDFGASHYVPFDFDDDDRWPDPAGYMFRTTSAAGGDESEDDGSLFGGGVGRTEEGEPYGFEGFRETIDRDASPNVHHDLADRDYEGLSGFEVADRFDALETGDAIHILV